MLGPALNMTARYQTHTVSDECTPERTNERTRRGWYCEIPLISEGVYLQIEQAEQLGQ